jgi:predicted nucleic acid-binding protein
VTQIDTLLAHALRDGHPVALDSSALIAFFSDDQPFARIIERLIESDVLIVLSAITLSESLVRFIAIHGRASAEKISASLHASSTMRLVPFGTLQIVEAAEIRSETRLKFPDAAIIATARVAGAIAIVGNDRAWQNKSLGIQYIHLDDVVREAQMEEELH